MSRAGKRLFIFLAVLVIVLLSVVLYDNSLKEDGKFIAQFLNENDISDISVSKIDTRTEDIIKTNTLNKDERERLSLFFENQTFKNIKSKTVPFESNEGYIIEGLDKEGRKVFFIESYGDEFMTGSLIYGDSPASHFKYKIQNDNWINTMEYFL